MIFLFSVQGFRGKTLVPIDLNLIRPVGKLLQSILASVQEQEATIAQLESAVGKQEATAARQQKQIAALTAGLTKVSAQLELTKSAPQTVLNATTENRY